ncbi:MULTISPECIES: hypothetical protein [unclassified Haladaptatus]|uniref:hypothetical protein n=1 Tax=unclassified Haladaptatus TaxID=2622732 RepID=UPI0023E781B1|nr:MULTISPECIES: hypothetical protein [unclassified Haladaptatus]
MAQSNDAPTNESTETVYKDYILDVQILERQGTGGDTEYCFDAPGHKEMVFAKPDLATLYADIYFDVNGFEEAGTGERGVPPEIIQAGRDTLAAYFLTQPYADVNWVASFYGKKPTKIERYVAAVRNRAEEIREGAANLGME